MATVATPPKAADLAFELLKVHEGFRDHLYDDKTGLRIGRLPSGGWPTFGYGFNLAHWPATEEECALILRSRIFTLISQIAARQPLYSKLTPKRQAVLIDMAYQTGIDGLMNFRQMFRYIRLMDYSRASEEILNSDSGRRFVSRYKTLAQWMLNG